MPPHCAMHSLLTYRTITCGGACSMALAETGHLFYWGKLPNAPRGEVRLSNVSSTHLRLVSMLCSAGWCVSLMLKVVRERELCMSCSVAVLTVLYRMRCIACVACCECAVMFRQACNAAASLQRLHGSLLVYNAKLRLLCMCIYTGYHVP
jgi:hypothetical protein